MVLAAFGGAALSLLLSFWAGPRIASAVMDGTIWLRQTGPLGWLIFCGLEFVVTLIGIVPGALLGIVAGAIFGLVAGFCSAAGGILAGSFVAFYLSRTLLRPWFGRLLHGRMRQLDGVIARDGWRLVALLRISPVMPFSITSYALGLSGISLDNYILGTCAALPPLLGYVAIGALGGWAGNPHGRQGLLHLAMLGFGAVATLALTLHLSRLLARVLRRAPEAAMPAGEAEAPGV